MNYRIAIHWDGVYWSISVNTLHTGTLMDTITRTHNPVVAFGLAYGYLKLYDGSSEIHVLSRDNWQELQTMARAILANER
jgi:hypothetical protein